MKFLVRMGSPFRACVKAITFASESLNAGSKRTRSPLAMSSAISHSERTMMPRPSRAHL